MTGHARLAPSAASRWLECPGSVLLAERYPDTSSEAADEGTFAHELAAELLHSGKSGASVIGHRSLCGRFEVDADFADALDVYLEHCRELLAGARESAEALGERPPVVLIERAVALGIADFNEVPGEDVTGTADFVVIDNAERVVHVVDLKFGSGVFVDVHENPQLAIYGVGARWVSKLLSYELRLHVVQPRHHRGPAVRSWIPPGEWLKSLSDRILEARRNAFSDAPRFAAGDHCGFCPAKIECRAYNRAAEDAVLEVLSDDEATVELSNERIAEVLSKVSLVREWLSLVEGAAYTRANAGQRIPGFKLVEHRGGHRKWRDEAEARAVLEVFGVDPNAPSKTISPAEAERRCKGFASWVDGHTIQPKTGTALVPETDGRPSVHPADLFDVLDS